MAKASTSGRNAPKVVPLSERAKEALELLRGAPAGGYSTASVEFNLYWDQNSGGPAMRELVEHGKVTVRKTRVGDIEMYEVVQ
jgi:hypothetical protein